MSPSGGRDHDGGAVHDVVAGEQQALALEQEAEVVRGVARACGWPAGVNSVPSTVSPSARWRSNTSPSRSAKARTSAPVRSLRPAAPGEWSGWVWVQRIQRMRSLPAAGDGVEVGGVVRARVDDRDLVDADQVGVGARPGHHPGVAAEDPADQLAQGIGDVGDERRAGRLVGVGGRSRRGLRRRRGRWPARGRPRVIQSIDGVGRRPCSPS